ncbi:hypothetical protein [Nocardia bovistercoris]|uniref:Uncharacterized protein n=1 Tax=Nocardia bovistercoris TaxID=2785916 RepID=A0A931IB95_9NOCA|nr:hypothetical protein [Nocardia bovistercoris]MBH0777285.1 hypothetical protein [Nocardia bovistercoris]
MPVETVDRAAGGGADIGMPQAGALRWAVAVDVSIGFGAADDVELPGNPGDKL